MMLKYFKYKQESSAQAMRWPFDLISQSDSSFVCPFPVTPFPPNF